MPDRLNILIIHRLGDPRTWRASARDIEFCLPDYAPEHNYIVHNDVLPLPSFIKEIDFHAIILGETFLSYRSPSFIKKARKKYDFIKNTSAFKIAMPQDNYACSAVMERLFLEWNVDVVYNVCPEHWDILYPKLNKLGKIKLGYTGYVADKMIDSRKTPKPFELRKVDVCYRVRDVEFICGKLGQIKRNIGEIFQKEIERVGETLTLDISSRPEDTLYGEKWLDFIEGSKFILGSSSGSSLLDPEGKIRARVDQYLALHPKATFEETAAACFPQDDGKWSFTAISPRNIEAALLETVQILTPGSYSGIMLPEEHYIPFEPDGSNIHDVLAMMKDTIKVKKIASACKDAFLSVKELRYSYHVRQIVEEIAHAASTKRIIGTSAEQMQRYVRKYEEYSQRYSKYCWPYLRLVSRVKQVAIALGARRAKNLLTFGNK